MGAKSERRKKFLAGHPICCFCGGNTPAVEEDHIPSRALFRNRQWPEGYVFPACKPCNEASRYDEQVIAFLCRAQPDIETEQDDIEANKAINALVRHHRDLVDELMLRPTGKRKALRSLGIKKPVNVPTSEIPIISANGPKLNAAIQSFGRKLFLALYYKHTKKILPPGGGVGVRWRSNVQIGTNNIPDEVLELARDFPNIERCNTSLHDQFTYRCGVSDDARGSVFLVKFRQSFVMVGFVFQDAKVMKAHASESIWHPYNIETS